MKQRFGVAAAAFAAALLAAGCTSGGAATESATSAVDAPLRATATAPMLSPAPEAPTPEWVDVSGQGTVLPRDDQGRQYSATPVPGAAIFHWPASDGEAGSCTLGPAVREIHGTRTGFLTAGHCAKPPFEPQQYLGTGPGPDDVAAQPLGSLTQVADTDAVDPGMEDAGVIWTPEAEKASTIAGFRVVGAMSEADLKNLPEGTPICVDGTVSGVACAPLYSATNVIRYGHSAFGDSGAAAFVVNRDGEATLVGLHSEAYVASILARTLERLGLEPITAS